MTHAYSLLALAWFASLWQGAAMALLAAACLHFMPRAGAAVRHLLLVTIFAVAAFLPMLPLHTHARSEHPAGIALAPWVAVVIAMLWLAASAVRAAGLLQAWLHLRQVRAAATPIELAGTKVLFAGQRRAALCESDAIDSPAVLGFFRPMLLLPASLVPTLSDRELRDIALHECEHLRRRDDWTNLLLEIGLVLMPLNPALLWLNRRIATERELACDAAVVATTTQPIAYAAALTRIAEQRIRQHGVGLALAALGRESELAQRVHALLSQPTKRWSQRQCMAALVASVAVLVSTATGLVHAPRFITIASPVAASVAVARDVPPMPIAPMVQTAQPAMTMLPVSYQIKTVTKRAPKASRRTVHISQTATKQNLSQPVRFVRTAYTPQRMPVRDAVQYDDRPARSITAEFVPDYVALPVANGWLLIAL